MLFYLQSVVLIAAMLWYRPDGIAAVLIGIGAAVCACLGTLEWTLKDRIQNLSQQIDALAQSRDEKGE